MIGRGRKNRQLEIFEVPMNKFIDLDHELVRTGDLINWSQLEQQFKAYYADRGRPGVPVRKIVGLSLLKSRFNIGEEKALEIWLQNPYWQYFCGEVHFQKERPFSTGEFGRFKKRVGPAGMEKVQLLATEYFGMKEDCTYNHYRDRKKSRSFLQRFFEN